MFVISAADADFIALDETLSVTTDGTYTTTVTILEDNELFEEEESFSVSITVPLISASVMVDITIGTYACFTKPLIRD